MQYKKVTELSKEELEGLINCIKNWDRCYDEEFKKREIVISYDNYDTRGVWIDIKVIYTKNITRGWNNSAERKYYCILYNDYSIEVSEYDDSVPIPVAVLEIAEYINNNLRIE